MALALRPLAPADVPAAGRICHDAFKAIAAQHNFLPDFPDPDVAIGLLRQLSANRGFYGVVAEEDGRILGSNFIDERSPIIGLGPITVDPGTQKRAKRPVILAANESVAIEFCCRSASVRRKITPNEPAI